jgi:hypothetical protein
MHDYDEDEWTEFRLLAMSTFLQFEVRHIDRDLRTGHGEQITNRLDVAKGLITAFPAWALFWQHQTESSGFSQAFIDAVNSAPGKTDLVHISRGTAGKDPT